MDKKLRLARIQAASDLKVIKEKHEETYLKKKGVTGIGVGLKIVGGEITDKVVITIFVEKKHPLSKLSAKDVIPSIIDGVETDVVETGIIRPTDVYTQKTRPAIPAYSLGRAVVPNEETGTFGCVCYKGTNKYILTNSHVLGNDNTAVAGDNVIQPGQLDGGNAGTDVVATLDSYVTMVNGVNSDSALAKFTSDALVSPVGVWGDRIKTYRDPVLGDVIFKSGRTTGDSSNPVTQIHTTTAINYGGATGTISVADCFITNVMTGPGDSGSSVRYDNTTAAGLTFAASPTISIHTPMSNIVSRFGIGFTPAAGTCVQLIQGNGGAYTTAYTKAFRAPVSAGSLLVLTIGAGSADTPAISDNRNGAWTLINSIAGASSGRKTQMWYVQNAQAGATTISVSLPGGGSDSFIIAKEYVGVVTTNALDQHTTHDDANWVTTHNVGSTGVTTQASELSVAGICADVNAETWTAGSGYGNLVQQGGFDAFTGGAMQDLVVSTVGTQFSNFNTTANHNGQSIIATFKLVGASSPSASPSASPSHSVSSSPSASPSPSHSVSASPSPSAGGSTVSWKGFNWTKRNGGTGSPGYGGWSQNNISGPDSNGYLTFFITNPSGSLPIGSEMFLSSSLGYGTYTSVVDQVTNPNTWNKNIVWGGMFPINSTTPYIEFDAGETSKWDQDFNSTALAGLSVIDHNMWHGTAASPSNTGSGDEQAATSDIVVTNRLIWVPGDVTMDTFAGVGTGGTLLFHSHYTANVPVPGTEVVDFNFWPYASGTGTQTNNLTASIILRDFTFVPRSSASSSPSASPSPSSSPSHSISASPSPSHSVSSSPSPSVSANNITRVQSIGATSGASFVNTLPVIWPHNVVAGDYLTLVIASNNPSATIAPVVTDTTGNTWVQRVNVGGSSQSTNAGLFYYDCQNCLGGTTPTITITLSQTSGSGGTPEFDNISAVAAEYTGIKLTSAIDVFATGLDSSFIQAPHNTGTTATTSQANELIIVAAANPNDLSNFSIASPFSTPITEKNATGATDGFLSLGFSDKIVSATGTQTANFSTDTFSKGVAFIVAVKGVDAVASIPVPAAPVSAVVSTASNRAYFSWIAPRTTLVGGFPVTTNITSFTVKRSTTSGSGYTTLASGVTNAFYDDTTVVNGTTYYYVVTATSPSGTSSNSIEAVAVVAPPVPHGDSWYAFGTAPTGVSQSTIRGYLQAHWNKYISYCMTNAGGGLDKAPWGALRISAPDQQFGAANSVNGTVSEGVAYGMVSSVYMSNPANPVYDIKALSYFHGFLAYYQYWGDNSWTGSKGLMNWIINNDGTQGTSQYGATDADLDAVFSIFMMHRLRGSTGAVNYLAIANNLAKQVHDYEFTASNASPPNIIMNGDGWGPGDNILAPDYLRFGYFDIFQYHTGDNTWATIKTANWNFIATHFTSAFPSGLVVDACDRSGVGTNLYGWGDFKYSYNSIRMGFGYTLDYLWHGTPAAYNNQFKMASTAITRSGNNINNVGQDQTNIASPGTGGTSQTFASGYGSAATVDPSTAQFAGQAATYIHSQVTENSYFGLSQGLLNLLLMSGEFTPTFGAIPTSPSSSPSSSPSGPGFSPSASPSPSSSVSPSHSISSSPSSSPSSSVSHSASSSPSPSSSISSSPSPSTGFNIVTTTDDTFYGSAVNPGPNGASQTLSFGGFGDINHSYIKFDVTTAPAPAFVSSVLLSVYVEGPSVNDPIAQVRLVTSAWVGTTLTRTNLPTDDGISHGSFPSLAGGVPRWVTVNITPIYNSWKNTPASNFGLKIHSTVGSNQNTGVFTSKEGTSGRAPRLLITGLGSPSSSPSASVSSSPSPSSASTAVYTRGSFTTLPTNSADLPIVYSSTEKGNISIADNILVGQDGNSQYLIHEFKEVVGANNRCTVRLTGQSTVSTATSPVVLQVYNLNSSTWETMATNSTTLANTPFTFVNSIDNLTNYKDVNNRVTFRLYRLSSG